MSTMNILTIAMLLVTVLAGGDMAIFFWHRHQLRRRQVSISRHLRLAVEGMEPVHVREESDVLESH